MVAENLFPRVDYISEYKNEDELLNHGFLKNFKIFEHHVSFCHPLHRIIFEIQTENSRTDSKYDFLRNKKYKIYFLNAEEIYSNTTKFDMKSFLVDINISTNVVDEYKGLTRDEIDVDLEKKRLPFAACVENWKGDYNLGTCIRNANAFGAQEIFYLGPKGIDKRTTVGAFYHTKVKHVKEVKDLFELKKFYTFIAIDNISSYNPLPLESFVWPKNPLMIFGSEGSGLSKETIEMCDVMVYITQYGSVRSLNAGTSTGIVFYDFAKKYTK